MNPKFTYLSESKDKNLHEIDRLIKFWNGNESILEVSTSGSTGKPKKIQLRKEKIKASAKATGDFFGFNESWQNLLCISPAYIGGKMQVFRSLLFDMNLLIVEAEADPLQWITKNQKIDFAAFVPYQVGQILKSERSTEIFASIGKVIIGGAPVSNALEKSIMEVNPNVYSTFGMTETISHCALRKLGQESFTGIEGYRFEQDDRECLVVNHPVILDDKIVSNDVVDLISERTFIWKGRRDYVINSGGVKIHPEMLEKAIEPLLSGNRYYFTSAENIELGEELVLMIEGENGVINISELKSSLKQVLPKYHVPKQIVFQEKFNETASGKILRLKIK